MVKARAKLAICRYMRSQIVQYRNGGRRRSRQEQGKRCLCCPVPVYNSEELEIFNSSLAFRLVQRCNCPDKRLISS